MDWFLVTSCLLVFILSLQISGNYGCFQEERSALLDFKASVQSIEEDDSGLLLPSWTNGSSSDCCSWERVTCNSTTGHIIVLYLNETRPNYDDMSGWYLNISAFQHFKELRILNLSFNAIAEFLVSDNEDSRSLSELNRLEHVDLSMNYLDNQVFKVLGRFSALRSLYLQNNVISGPLSDPDLAALSNLEVLNLQFNNLNGTLPVHCNQNSVHRYAISKLFLSMLIWSLFLLCFLVDLANFSSLKILDLSWNRFTGSIPSNIGHHLSSLRALTLSRNSLNGSLPAEGLCQFQKLEELDLSQNSFQGAIPPCFSNLTSLRLLDLSENQLSGKISSSIIAGLTSLQYIDLSHNQFEGVFSFSSFHNHSILEVVQMVNNNDNFEVETEHPSWIPSFQLKVLVLTNCNLNKFSKIIPTFLFQQHELRVLDLAHNNLKGRLDLLLGNSTRLEFLSVRNNSLTGQLILPPSYDAKSSWIDVSDNQLCGKIQANIGKILPNAIYLNFAKNAFEGTVSSSIGDMVFLEQLDMSFNNFSGEVPEELFANLVWLQTLKLSGNRFRGQIVPANFNLTWLNFLHLDNNQFTGSLSNVILRSSQLEVLDISNNNISGNIPSWISSMTFLRTFAMRNNQLNGSLPCNIPLTVDLLDLSYNYLTGSIPSCLNPVGGLYLQGNKFTGSIPESLFNSTRRVLNIRDNSLSGKIPDPKITPPGLQALLLGGNKLNGVIPSRLCLLNNIAWMDLSNNLLSGPIPPCFYNITFNKVFNYYPFFPQYFRRTIYASGSFLLGQYSVYNPDDDKEYGDGAIEFLNKGRFPSYKGDILDSMSGLDLSSNNLSGIIPPELGRLNQIHSLNLSRNQLTGSIPGTFSNMSQIESLDLSYNRLSGAIPEALIDLHFLKFFSVAHNNLSGRIPDIKPQIGLFDNSSYEGNSFLCGFPLGKSCRLLARFPYLKA